MTPFLDAETVALANSVRFDEEPMRWGIDDEGRAVPQYTLEQVERWLWENHAISIEVERFLDEEGPHFLATVWIENQYAPITLERSIEGYDPFTARLEGVKKALQYIKQMKEGE